MLIPSIPFLADPYAYFNLLAYPNADYLDADPDR